MLSAILGSSTCASTSISTTPPARESRSRFPPLTPPPRRIASKLRRGHRAEGRSLPRPAHGAARVELIRSLALSPPDRGA